MTSTGERFGGDQPISVPNLDAAGGKIVISGDALMNIFNQMNIAVRGSFSKNVKPVTDVIVMGTLLYDKQTKTADVDGCLTVKMVLSP